MLNRVNRRVNAINPAALVLTHHHLPAPHIVVGGLRFYRDSSSLFRQLPSDLIERNSTKPAMCRK